MPRIESYAPGSFCWGELATSDVEGAKNFYGAMFGWTVQEIPFPGGVYNMFLCDGNDAAAAAQARPGVPTHWEVYFAVENVEESATRVTELGGKILAGPFDVMESGRMAAAQDPQGAHFSLWQAKAHIGATHGGPFHQMTWPELTTPDAVSAVAFYAGLFGWKTKPETGWETAEYLEWVNAGRQMGGLMPMRGDMWKGVPPHWMSYITVADCDQSAAKVKELGGTVCVPPTDIPNVGRFSVVADPQGATFSLVRMAAASPPAAATA